MTILAHDYYGMSDRDRDCEYEAQRECTAALRDLAHGRRRSAIVRLNAAANLSSLREKQLRAFADALADLEYDIDAAIHDYAPDMLSWDEAIVDARRRG